MGKVTSYKVTGKDESAKSVKSFEDLRAIGNTERVEMEYAYGPDLLPANPWSNSGMWRYLALLPTQDEILYPLAVGGTPLLAPLPLRQLAGLPGLWLKDETRSPTGSNKDRATALSLEYALHNKIQTISCASTGNVALSLAVGAAACGLKAVIFVPASILDSKLQYMRVTGATIFKVKEGYEAAVRLSREAAHAFGWYDRNTGYNPLTLEAKKTVAFEIWEQMGHQVPDSVVVPVGDGVTLNGLAKGFRELMFCGATTKLPRIIGVQAENCQPLKRMWEGHSVFPCDHKSTIADGIAVEAPINAGMALRDIRESRGGFVAVSEEALLNAIALLATTSGILAEPAGAAALAGIRPAVEQGLLKVHETFVVLVTGSGFKTPQYLRPPTHSPVYEILADINELKQIRAHSNCK
ncbi:pyridoxal-phosphate dependent enzyme [Ktedonosporobacter rubrisoli]|uniref:Pyridoxal-phosphate dependent enzyme n=1 Tax=Ktedonosporobacter rubrisoli TaxID=2509675 RepID=A0A4P6JQ20_KTERU|nr:pyridoxal-phosphate dependent enzyme [Ktedonosporobacter rubrisoli]QBD77260.1 pyridoxal-phosphate dependent enzyme [Ktedonosporobacter rubrisoli]